MKQEMFTKAKAAVKSGFIVSEEIAHKVLSDGAFLKQCMLKVNSVSLYPETPSQTKFGSNFMKEKTFSQKTVSTIHI